MSKTEQLIKSLEGMYYRLDKGLNTGRNATSTDRTLDARWTQLAEALEAGGFEELDANERLAARYSRLEHRKLGRAQ